MSKSIDDVMDRIRKLLELSKSPNEHEAALAAARAAELMIRYQLSEAQLETPAWIGEHRLETSTNLVYWRTAVAGGLAKAFGCQIVIETLRGGGKKREQTLVVVGRASDFEAIRYMHGYLCNEIDRLAAAAYRVRQYGLYAVTRPQAYKNAFRMSAARVIADRLVEERARRKREAGADPDMSQALVRLDQFEQAVKDFCERAGAETKHKGRATVSDGLGVMDGRKAGEKVDLGKDKTQLTAGALRLPAKGGDR